MKDGDASSNVNLVITSAKQYKQHSQAVFDSLASKSVTYTENFLSAIRKAISDKELPPDSRFYALLLLVKSTENQNEVLIDRLAKNKELLNIIFTGSQVDATKAFSEKGKQYFSKTPTKEQEIIGNNFVNLCLEAFSYWNQTYGTNQKNIKSIFSASYAALEKLTKFPTKFIFVGQMLDVNPNFHTTQHQKSVEGGTESKFVISKDFKQEPKTASKSQEIKPQAESLKIDGKMESSVSSRKNTLPDINLQTAKEVEIESYLNLAFESGENFDAVWSNVKPFIPKASDEFFKQSSELLSKTILGTNPPKAKFYALYFIAKLSEAGSVKFIKTLVGEKELMNKLFKHASFSKKRKASERGGTFFSSNPNEQLRTLGNNYITLLLELCLLWFQNFASKDKNDPFYVFNNFYTRLSKEDDIEWPEEYMYIGRNLSTLKNGAGDTSFAYKKYFEFPVLPTDEIFSAREEDMKSPKQDPSTNRSEPKPVQEIITSKASNDPEYQMIQQQFNTVEEAKLNFKSTITEQNDDGLDLIQYFFNEYSKSVDTLNELLSQYAGPSSESLYQRVIDENQLIESIKAIYAKLEKGKIDFEKFRNETLPLFKETSNGTPTPQLIKNDENNAIERNLKLANKFDEDAKEDFQPKIQKEEPKYEQPKSNKSRFDQPKNDQNKIEQPKAESVKVEQPKVEQPKIEQPKFEQPKFEKPKSEQPRPIQPMVEQKNNQNDFESPEKVSEIKKESVKKEVVQNKEEPIKFRPISESNNSKFVQSPPMNNAKLNQVNSPSVKIWDDKPLVKESAQYFEEFSGPGIMRNSYQNEIKVKNSKNEEVKPFASPPKELDPIVEKPPVKEKEPEIILKNPNHSKDFVESQKFNWKSHQNYKSGDLENDESLGPQVEKKVESVVVEKPKVLPEPIKTEPQRESRELERDDESVKSAHTKVSRSNSRVSNRGTPDKRLESELLKISRSIQNSKTKSMKDPLASLDTLTNFGKTAPFKPMGELLIKDELERENAKLKKENEALAKENQLLRSGKHEAKVKELENNLRTISAERDDLLTRLENTDIAIDRIKVSYNAEIEDLKNKNQDLENLVMNQAQELETLRGENQKKNQAKDNNLLQKLKELQQQNEALSSTMLDLQTKNKNLSTKVEELEDLQNSVFQGSRDESVQKKKSAMKPDYSNTKQKGAIETIDTYDPSAIKPYGYESRDSNYFLNEMDKKYTPKAGYTSQFQFKQYSDYGTEERLRSPDQGSREPSEYENEWQQAALQDSGFDLKKLMSHRKSDIQIKVPKGVVVESRPPLFTKLIKRMTNAPFLNTLFVYKMSCLKNKCPIFDNEIIQIGITSSIIRNQSSGSNLVKLGLYFGNKTNDKIESLRINFSDDSAVAKSTKPSQINEDILPGKQAKQQLIFAFQKVPYFPIEMNCSVFYAGEKVNFSLVLPSLITKFMELKDSTSDEFRAKWKQINNSIFKTEEIELDTTIVKTPYDFKKFYSNLIDLKPMDEYEYVQGKKDIKLGAVFELENPGVEFLWKIHVFPNNRCLFQLASEFATPEETEFVLQSLEFLFKKH